MTSRRQVLTTALPLAITMPGCLTKPEEPDQVYIDDIVLKNDDKESHTVTIHLTDDGDTVLEESFDIPAGGSVSGLDFPTDLGAYKVSASLDGGTSYTQNLGAYRDGDQMCVYVTFRVTLGESLGVDITTGTDCNTND